MALEDIIKFQLKRVNPFQGLVIDAETWRDAHSYHRDQMRLHLLSHHKTGIIEGLEVTASSPPSLSVNIHPGIGVDPEGNYIIVSQTQRYRIQSRDKSTIHLIIQFREIPSEPYQPPNGGQPTRILEAYRIEERDKPPAEPHIELARIDFDPAGEAIRDAKIPSNPAKNEINLSFREKATLEAPPAAPKRISPALETTRTRETITIGHAVLGKASQDLNSAGLNNLIREINRQNDLSVQLEENIPLDQHINRCIMIYVTGSNRFELSAEQQAAFKGLLKTGGLILGEGASERQDEELTKGVKEFGLAFNQLASQLKCKLEIVQRGHPLLSIVNVFSEVPPGAEPGMLLEGGHMIYSGSNYGAAWQGGYKERPLPREVIRSAFEMGANIIAYAKMIKGATP